jgi:hypothetical protein
VRAILNSGPDGGACPPVGACRGFEGTCGQLAEQFAAVPVLPDYPAGMADYACHAFPDDDAPLDSFIVGLISIAIALPVASFCQTCFAIANDSEAPESWLEWVGWRKLVFGFNAHRKWHYTKRAQPLRHVKWFIRSIGAPQTETAMNLLVSVRCWLTCTEPPWIVEARDAEEEAEAAGTADEEAKPAKAGSEKASTSSSVRSARALSRYKRSVMAIGLAGIYICWAIFTWCVRPCVVHASIAPLLFAFAPWIANLRSLPTSHAGSSSCTACSYTSCWAMARSSLSRAAGASATASTRRRSGRSAGGDA